MSNENITTVDEVDGGMPPPPDFDVDDDVEVGDGATEGPEGPSDPDAAESFDLGNPNTTGRGRRRRGGAPQQRRGPMPWENRDLDWDGWADCFSWGTDPSLKFILKRLAPERAPNGVPIAGVVETREMTPIHLEEIRGTYGGGQFEAMVTGVHPRNPGAKPGPLSRRRVQLPGPPIASNATLPRGSTHMGSTDPMTKAAMDLVRDEVTSLRRRGEESPRLAEKTIDTMKEVSEHRVKAAEAGADARVEIINRQLEEQRQRNIELERRLKDTETDMIKRTAENHEKLTTVVADVQNNSLATIMQLIPTLSGKSDEQVRQMATLYQAREERLAADHKSQLQQMQANYQTQLQAQQTLGQAQLESIKAQHAHMISLLENQLQISHAEVASLRREVEHLRTMLDQKNQDLMNKIAEGKQTKSAVEQMTEIGTIFEAMESMRGAFGGGAAPTDDDGIENPLTRKLLKMGEGVIQNAPAILDALRNRGGAAPGVAPGMMPPGAMVPMQQSMPQPQMYRQPPRVAVPRPATPPAPVQASPSPPPTAKVNKKDVETALAFIANVLEAGGENPPAATAVAQTAIAHADNAVLKALAQRKPESVIEQLGAQGMLQGPLSTDAGKKYLHELLEALKAHFTTP